MRIIPGNAVTSADPLSGAEEVFKVEREVGSANLAAMRSNEAVTHYASMTYVDPGEKVLYDKIAAEAAGKPILDIGVGGGRTVPYLTAISSDYTALDYSAEMVAAFKQRFPGLRILHANATDLSAFDDASIFLAVFSGGGLDMVGRADRHQIFHEVRRVLAPGGAFIFATHNLDSQRLDPSLRDLVVPIPSTSNPFKFAWRAARSLRDTSVRMWNFHRLKHLAERHEDWAILNTKYHDFGTLHYYITAGGQRSDLAEAGFAPNPLVYTNEGLPLTDAVSATCILHWMARVPEPASPF